MLLKIVKTHQILQMLSGQKPSSPNALALFLPASLSQLRPGRGRHPWTPPCLSKELTDYTKSWTVYCCLDHSTVFHLFQREKSGTFSFHIFWVSGILHVAVTANDFLLAFGAVDVWRNHVEQFQSPGMNLKWIYNLLFYGIINLES